MGVEVTWFEHIISLLFVGIIGIVLIKILYKEIKECRGLRKVTVQTTLHAKRMEQNVAQTMYKTTQTFENGVTEIRSSYWFVFDVGEGQKQLEFEVSKEMYDKISEDTQGILEYRGHELLSFAGVPNDKKRRLSFISLGE